MLISRPIQSTSIKIGQIKCSDFFFFVLKWLKYWCLLWNAHAQLPCYFSLCRNMTPSFTSFSIKDILAGRDIRGPVGEMSTGGHSASQPAAGNLCADIKTRNYSLGDFQHERPDILRGSSEDRTKLSNTKGEQQMLRVYIVVVVFLSLKLDFSKKCKMASLEHNITYTNNRTCFAQ